MDERAQTTSSSEGAPEPGEQAPKQTGRESQQGIAILMVLIALAILFPFTASFNYKARVDWQSAVNHGDEVRARAVQRGAMQLSVLMFELQRMVFNQKQFRDFMGAMDITQLAPYLMAIFGTEDGAEGLAALAGIDVDTPALNELALDGGGSFEVRLEAESGKLNVNCFAVDKQGNEDPRGRVAETLEAMMLPKLYDPLFDEEKSNGQRYNRQHTLQSIIDYIDNDSKRYDAYRLRQSSRDEATDYHYTDLTDPYEPRNARLDSILELHMAEAVDDDWMAAFGPEMTIYGGCKVNINFASADQIAQVIRHAVSGRDRWKTEGENFLLMTLPLANFVVEQREFNLFKKLDDFKQLVNKPDQFVSPGFMFGDDSSDDDVAANLPKVPDGIEVRINGGSGNGSTWGGVKEVATVSPERVYRLEVITTVGSVRKRVSAVYDIQYARSQTAGKGAWLYYRED